MTRENLLNLSNFCAYFKNTEICKTSSGQLPIFKSSTNYTERKIKEISWLKLALSKFHLIGTENECSSGTIMIIQNDPVFSCIKEDNGTVIFYKHYEYR